MRQLVVPSPNQTTLASHDCNMDILTDRDKVRRYYLNQDVAHVLHNGDILYIGKGYRFNAHSVPWPLHLIFKRYDEKDIRAALAHDFLVDTYPWHRYTRKFIDHEYKVIMQQESYGWRRRIMPLAVTIFGFIRTFGWREYRGEYKDRIKLVVKVDVV